jgi:hypothetical protein
MLMLTFSLYRKVVIIAVAVFFDLTVVQFMKAVYVQELYACYVMAVNPMIGFTRNKVEFVNEILILLMIFVQCTLTDFVPSPDIRQNITGWTVICMIYISIVLNVTFLMIDVKNSIIRI